MLGFRLTDFYNKPFGAYFMHVNPRHHSLAFIRTGKNAVHHIMMELYLVRRRRSGLRHRADGRGPRRHHARPPYVGFHHLVLHLDAVGLHDRVRLGRARHRSRDTGKAFERTEGPSLWGHERDWLPEKERNAAREKRMQLARDGVRQPVQVIEGNFEVSPGICPWLDGIAQQRRA